MGIAGRETEIVCPAGRWRTCQGDCAGDSGRAATGLGCAAFSGGEERSRAEAQRCAFAQAKTVQTNPGATHLGRAPASAKLRSAGFATRRETAGPLRSR